MKVVTVGWTNWLIAIGLIVVIPVLVSLGINLVVPNMNWQNYSKDRDVYFKGMKKFEINSDEKRKQYDQQEALWKESAEWQIYKAQYNNHLKIEILIGCLMMFLLLFVAGRLQEQIMLGAFIVAAAIIYQLHVAFGNWDLHSEFGAMRDIVFGGVSIVIWQIITVAACLLLVLWYAYRDSLE